jgi:hypothetical protein
VAGMPRTTPFLFGLCLCGAVLAYCVLVLAA